MTATATTTNGAAPVPVDTKAGFCTNCRSGMHVMCTAPKCQCPDARKHRRRPGYGQPVPGTRDPGPANRGMSRELARPDGPDEARPGRRRPLPAPRPAKYRAFARLRGRCSGW